MSGAMYQFAITNPWRGAELKITGTNLPLHFNLVQNGYANHPPSFPGNKAAGACS
jgi:hypothetical protein